MWKIASPPARVSLRMRDASRIHIEGKNIARENAFPAGETKNPLDDPIVSKTGRAGGHSHFRHNPGERYPNTIAITLRKACATFATALSRNCQRLVNASKEVLFKSRENGTHS